MTTVSNDAIRATNAISNRNDMPLRKILIAKSSCVPDATTPRAAIGTSRTQAPSRPRRLHNNVTRSSVGAFGKGDRGE
jgi:hypothetical protein